MTQLLHALDPTTASTAADLFELFIASREVENCRPVTLHNCRQVTERCLHTPGATHSWIRTGSTRQPRDRLRVMMLNRLTFALPRNALRVAPGAMTTSAPPRLWRPGRMPLSTLLRSGRRSKWASCAWPSDRASYIPGSAFARSRSGAFRARQRPHREPDRGERPPPDINANCAEGEQTVGTSTKGRAPWTPANCHRASSTASTSWISQSPATAQHLS